MKKLLPFLVTVIALLVIATIIITEVCTNLTLKANPTELIDLHEIQFRSYMKKFSKHYGDDEYQVRLHNFKESLKEIARLNQNAGTASFGLTKFSDMSAEEFSSTMLMKEGYTGCDQYSWECGSDFRPKPHVFRNKTLPMKYDWRDYKDVVGPVLDQDQCLGCWAFSVVGVMESKRVIQQPSLGYQRLSIQELIDCSNLTDRCDGGNVAFALKYLCQNMWPITWADIYPLTLVDEACRFNMKPEIGIFLKSFNVLCNIDEMQIMELIIEEGPVTATVDASLWGQYYLDGIMQRYCSSTYLKHVVQIVGYDRTTHPPHFIIKNSWGKNFGIEGYMKIAMGNFTCGIGRQIGFLSVR